MDNGRIGAVVAELRRRLVSVRESIRASPPTLTEFLDDGSQSNQEEPAATGTADPVSIDGDGQLQEEPAHRSGPSPVLDWQSEELEPFERRILEVLLEVFPDALNARQLVSRLESTDVPSAKCDKSEVNSKLYRRLRDWLDREGDAPPYWSLRVVDDGDEAESVTTSEETHVEHTTSEPADSGSEETYRRSCSRCGGDVGRQTIVGEKGLLCGDCAEVVRAAPSPDLGWKGEKWDSLSRKILNELDEAFPESLTARELIRRLRRSGSKPEIELSDVKKTLYARLWDWVERDGEKSPEWSLRPAEDSTSTQRIDSDASAGEDYALCPMCMTERPASELTRFRNREICSSCMDDVLG